MLQHRHSSPRLHRTTCSPLTPAGPAALTSPHQPSPFAHRLSPEPRLHARHAGRASPLPAARRRPARLAAARLAGRTLHRLAPGALSAGRTPRRPARLRRTLARRPSPVAGRSPAAGRSPGWRRRGAPLPSSLVSAGASAGADAIVRRKPLATGSRRRRRAGPDPVCPWPDPSPGGAELPVQRPQHLPPNPNPHGIYDTGSWRYPSNLGDEDRSGPEDPWRQRGAPDGGLAVPYPRLVLGCGARLLQASPDFLTSRTGTTTCFVWRCGPRRLPPHAEPRPDLAREDSRLDGGVGSRWDLAGDGAPSSAGSLSNPLCEVLMRDTVGLGRGTPPPRSRRSRAVAEERGMMGMLPPGGGRRCRRVTRSPQCSSQKMRDRGQRRRRAPGLTRAIG